MPPNDQSQTPRFDRATNYLRKTPDPSLLAAGIPASSVIPFLQEGAYNLGKQTKNTLINQARNRMAQEAFRLQRERQYGGEDLPDYVAKSPERLLKSPGTHMGASASFAIR